MYELHYALCIYNTHCIYIHYLRKKPDTHSQCMNYTMHYVCAILTIYTYPPDPISHVCSLTGKYISRNYFTHRPVQIFKILLRRFWFSRISSSAQDHALLVLLLNLVGLFISTWQNLSARNDLYWRCTSFEKAFRRGRPLNILFFDS